MGTNLTTVKWRTSSYSGGTGNCVELAACTIAHDRQVADVRDSKDPEGQRCPSIQPIGQRLPQMLKAGMYDL
jgi:hypothetical protein